MVNGVMRRILRRQYEIGANIFEIVLPASKNPINTNFCSSLMPLEARFNGGLHTHQRG